MSETELYDSILFKNENLYRTELGISIKFNTDEAHKRRFICVKFCLILGMFCGCCCKTFRGCVIYCVHIVLLVRNIISAANPTKMLGERACSLSHSTNPHRVKL